MDCQKIEGASSAIGPIHLLQKEAFSKNYGHDLESLMQSDKALLAQCDKLGKICQELSCVYNEKKAQTPSNNRNGEATEYNHHDTSQEGEFMQMPHLESNINYSKLNGVSPPLATAACKDFKKPLDFGKSTENIKCNGKTGLNLLSQLSQMSASPMKTLFGENHLLSHKDTSSHLLVTDECKCHQFNCKDYRDVAQFPGVKSCTKETMKNGSKYCFNGSGKNDLKSPIKSNENMQQHVLGKGHCSNNANPKEDVGSLNIKPAQMDKANLENSHSNSTESLTSESNIWKPADKQITVHTKSVSVNISECSHKDYNPYEMKRTTRVDINLIDPHAKNRSCRVPDEGMANNESEYQTSCQDKSLSIIYTSGNGGIHNEPNQISHKRLDLYSDTLQGKRRSPSPKTVRFALD